MSQPFLSKEKLCERILVSPQSQLLDIFGDPSCDAVVFTYDRYRHFRYVSQSIQSLCGLKFPSPALRFFDDWLSESSSNQVIRSVDEFSLAPGKCLSSQCEVKGAGKLKIRLSLRRQVITLDGDAIGVVGIGWKLEFLKPLVSEDLASYNLGTAESSLVNKWKLLTDEELELLEAVVAGEPNKLIAKRFSLSERTVEARRSRMMKKLGLSNLPQLVRFHMLVKQATNLKDSKLPENADGSVTTIKGTTL